MTRLRYSIARCIIIFTFIVCAIPYISFAQECKDDRFDYFSLNDQLGNLKGYIDFGYCKQVRDNKQSQEITISIRKTEKASEKIMLHFNVEFTSTEGRTTTVEADINFEKDEYSRKGFGKNAHPKLQFTADKGLCTECPVVDIQFITVKELDLQFLSGPRNNETITLAGTSAGTTGSVTKESVPAPPPTAQKNPAPAAPPVPAPVKETPPVKSPDVAKPVETTSLAVPVPASSANKDKEAKDQQKSKEQGDKQLAKEQKAKEESDKSQQEKAARDQRLKDASSNEAKEKADRDAKAQAEHDAWLKEKQDKEQKIKDEEAKKIKDKEMKAQLAQEEKDKKKKEKDDTANKDKQKDANKKSDATAVKNTTPVADKKVAEPVAMVSPPATVETPVTPPSTTPPPPIAPPPPSVSPIPFPKEEYEEKSKDKVNQLQVYIQRISDKKNSINMTNATIDQCLKLFVNNGDDAIVGISSLNSESVRRLKVKEYLTNLSRLPYQKVEITWSELFLVDNFKLAPDGNYHATISFEQTFKGFNDNNMVYGDVTRKNIEIYVKPYSKLEGGTMKNFWDVLLGDIRVSQTQSLK